MQPDWQRIAQENQGLQIHSTRIIGEGWNCVAYLVNGELVFRFPKRSSHWEELHREIAFLAFAADRLPLLVPRYMLVVPGSIAAPHGYAAYPYLPGGTLNLRVLGPKQMDAAADAIALFLATLHTLKLPPDLSAGLPREDARVVGQQYLVEAERGIVPQLLPSEAKRLVKRLESYLEGPENFTWEGAVLHADLSAEHILMTDAAITGVIDFGDVNYGDPDYDFMYLLVDCGEAFVRSVAQRYGHRNIERLIGKLRYFALVDQIGTILHGTGLALDGQQHAAWQRLRQFLQR